ncbi:hypothetical protein [Streptomyces sp. ALB3]|uniref:hypothetical protein n=1 Tax=Streptomyces sp. ALB3 TaxID=3374278 RepID=UPI003795BA35
MTLQLLPLALVTGALPARQPQRVPTRCGTTRAYHPSECPSEHGHDQAGCWTTGCGVRGAPALEDRLAGVRLQAEELGAMEVVAVELIRERLVERLAQRAEACVRAREQGLTVYLEYGVPV